MVALDPEVVQRAATFKNIGMVKDPARMRAQDEGAWFYEVPAFGLNYRLPDVLAALGSNQLPARGVQGPPRRDPRPLQRRPRRHRRARAAGDPARRRPHLAPLRPADPRRPPPRALRPPPGQRHRRPGQLHPRHPVFTDQGYQRGLCPVAERFYEQEISLPLFPDLSDHDVDRVIDLVRGFVGA